MFEFFLSWDVFIIFLFYESIFDVAIAFICFIFLYKFWRIEKWYGTIWKWKLVGVSFIKRVLNQHVIF